MTLRLTRLDALVGIVDQQGRPSPQFHRLDQSMKEAIESAFADLEEQVAAIAAAQSAASAASAAATAARREDARTSSYPSSGSILSAADVGASATITVAAHTRIYPGADIADVAIAGGTVAGLGFSTAYFVYYDDTTLASTTPTFQATTTAATAQVGAAPGRHFVGPITTPADGGGGTTGSGGQPPGFGNPLP